MATVIRLRRKGKKKTPFYHVVVMDSRNCRDGNCVDQLGTYNPLVDSPEGLSLNKEKASEWVKKGAQISQTVRSLFVKSGILEKVPTRK